MNSNRQWNTFIRIFKIGVLNIFRNGWLTIAATAVMTVALIIISLAVVLNVTSKNAIDELAKNLKASIYLVDGISDADRLKVQKSLQSQDFVQSVEYISSVQAAKDLANDFNNDAEILQAYALVGQEQRLGARTQAPPGGLLPHRLVGQAQTDGGHAPARSRSSLAG
jgi:cell division protein FtsX